MKNALIRFITFPKRRPLVFFIGIGAIVLGVGVYLRLHTPAIKTLDSLPKTSLPTVLQEDLSQTDIKQSISLPEYPPEMDAYFVTSHIQTINELGPKLNLTQSTSINIWMDSSQKQALLFDPETERFSYTNSGVVGDFDAARVNVVNKDEAVQAANAFVQKTFTNVNLKANESSLRFEEKSLSHFDTVPSEQATAVTISYEYNFSGNNQIFTSLDIQSPLTVTVDSTNNIIAFNVSQYLLTQQNTVLMPTILQSDLIKSIKDGNLQVLRVAGKNPTSYSNSNIALIDIQKANLEYRYIPKLEAIIPVLHLQTTAQTRQASESAQFEILVPLIHFQ